MRVNLCYLYAPPAVLEVNVQTDRESDEIYIACFGAELSDLRVHRSIQRSLAQRFHNRCVFCQDVEIV